MHIQTRFRRLLILFAVMATILIGQKAQAEDAAAWFYKGVELEKLDKYQEAINSYDRALEIDPKLAQVWNNKGIALGKLGRYQEALESFNKVLEIDPNCAPAWHNKGVALGNLGRHQEAIESYNKALEIDPNYAPAWYGKGVALGSLGRHQESIESYNKALEIDPNYAPAWANKGWALGKLDKYQEALSYIEKALEINPKLAPAWWDSKAVVLYQLGNYKDAEVAAKIAVDLDKDNTLHIINNWGDILLKLRQYNKAERAYLRVEESKEAEESEKRRSYLGLAKVYIELGDELGETKHFEDALGYLDKVARLGIPEEKEGKGDYYFQRGYTNARLGRWREAEKNFLKCEEDPTAKENIGRIRNWVKGEGRPSPPKALVWGGWSLTGVSGSLLIASLVLYLKYGRNKFISDTVLQVLVPAFLVFVVLGIILPYIKSFTGPGGIGFEIGKKEITINPESAPTEIKLESAPAVIKREPL